MRGKNKLVPRLLGVTKESILRVDEKTKEVGTADCCCWRRTKTRPLNRSALFMLNRFARKFLYSHSVFTFIALTVLQ